MMPQETDDLSRYSEKELIIAIATGMDHQGNALTTLRADILKELTEIRGTQNRLELRIDEVEKKQDIMEGALALAKWLLVLTMGGPILGIIVGLIMGK